MGKFFKFQLLIVFACFVFFSGCTTVYKGENNHGGEPASTYDATPPANYNPVFIQSISPFNDKIHTTPQLGITSVDTRELNVVKLKVHLIDSSSVYLSGASSNQFKKIWCEVIDTFNGKPLIIKDFKIYENSEHSDKKTALAIVMDHSGSMGEERAVVVQKAVQNIIRNKTDRDAIALIRYDAKVIVESPLTFNKGELLNNHRIDGLNGYGGMTAITDAIDAATKLLATMPRSTEKAVVVFTDGWDNSSSLNQDSIIKFARANNIIICGVDFGTNINAGFIKKFSDSTSGFYNQIYSTDEFPLVFTDIYKRLKNNYVVEFKTKNLGIHNISLKLCLPKDNIVSNVTFDNTPDIGSIGLINIYFDLNKSTITKDSEGAISDVVSFMQLYSNMKIQLQGHTDSLNSTNDASYNQKLSQKRADAVRDLMIKRGISPNRIIAYGYGEQYPVATNDTEEGRAKNRRTEFVILSK